MVAQQSCFVQTTPSSWPVHISFSTRLKEIFFQSNHLERKSDDFEFENNVLRFKTDVLIKNVINLNLNFVITEFDCSKECEENNK